MKDRALELLIENGGAQTGVLLKSSRVFAHPANRDSEILNAPRAHTRILKVAEAGVSWKITINDAVCFEDHPVNNTIGKKAEELTRMNDKFVQYKANAVGFGSVGSSHFNHGPFK